MSAPKATHRTNEVASIDKYPSGAFLIGDDYGPEELARWYADEKEGYAELGARNARLYRYHYHAWNHHHAFRHLPSRTFDRVLGFGSAGLSSVTSTPITLTAGAGTSLAVTTQPSAAATSGVAFPQQPVIQIQDAAGNPLDGSNPAAS
jgi:hypothetical protein